MNPVFIRQVLICLMLCLWTPFGEASPLKIIPLGVLVALLPLHLKPPEKLVFCGFALLPFAVPSLEQRFYFAEAWLILAAFAGRYMRREELSSPLILFVFANFLFVLFSRLGWLPFRWFQAHVEWNEPSLILASSHPGLTDSPLSLCLPLILGWIVIPQNPRHRLVYGLPGLFLCLQSGSRIGVLLFLLAFLQHAFPKISPKTILLGLCALIGLMFLTLDAHYTKRPLKTRLMIWEAATKELSLLGHGPAWFQKNSGRLMPPDTECQKLSRIQFHPHNDLLHWLLAFGLPGLGLRIFFYFLVFKTVRSHPQSFPLLLALIGAQLNPDLLTSPGVPLFGLLWGSFHSGSETGKSSWLAIAGGFILIVLALLQWQTSIQSQSILKGQSVQLNPWFQSPSLLLNHASSLAQRGKFAQALEELEQLERHAPHYANLDYLKAGCQMYLGQQEQTLHSLRESLEFNPCHLQSMRALADILRRNHEEEEALLWENKATSLSKGIIENEEIYQPDSTDGTMSPNP